MTKSQDLKIGDLVRIALKSPAYPGKVGIITDKDPGYMAKVKILDKTQDTLWIHINYIEKINPAKNGELLGTRTMTQLEYEHNKILAEKAFNRGFIRGYQKAYSEFIETIRDELKDIINWRNKEND